jgi:hypothetical protein
MDLTGSPIPVAIGSGHPATQIALPKAVIRGFGLAEKPAGAGNSGTFPLVTVAGQFADSSAAD